MTARAVQGIGGALLAPAALATVTATFVDVKERARAFSVFGGTGSVTAGVFGPVFGWSQAASHGWASASTVFRSF